MDKALKQLGAGGGGGTWDTVLVGGDWEESGTNGPRGRSIEAWRWKGLNPEWENAWSTLHQQQDSLERNCELEFRFLEFRSRHNHLCPLRFWASYTRDNDSISIKGLLWGFNEVITINPLDWWPAKSQSRSTVGSGSVSEWDEGLENHKNLNGYHGERKREQPRSEWKADQASVSAPVMQLVSRWCD